MTSTVRLQLVVDDCDDEPLNLASRNVRDGDTLGAYALAVLCIETAVRLISWQAYRDKTRAEFDDIIEKLGEIA